MGSFALALPLRVGHAFCMEFDVFKGSVAAAESPPDGASLALQALWWDAKGDWARAHDLCQMANAPEGDWVHAYLHRVEGDLGNANYWYRRCRKPFYYGNVKDEWEAIARELLGR